MAHVADWKKEKLDELKNLMSKSEVIGLVAVDGIPGPQLQDMRRNLRKDSPFIVTKNNIIRLAISEMAKEKPGLEGLLDQIGQTQNGIIATGKNPFKLFAEIKATESKAPAKGGEIASEDIVVKEGETPFKPGPIVGELQKVGIPAAIMGGKVIIKKDKVLVIAGDKIPADIAGALTRLEIFPVNVGLKLKSVYEDGTIFGSNVLDIDPLEYQSQIMKAASGAFNLAMHMTYVTPMTVRPLLVKAQFEAINLAVNSGIFNEQTIKLLISKAHTQMFSLASQLGDGLDAELQDALQNRSAAPAAAAPAESAPAEPEKKEEEEKVSEEEAAAGLGALFG
ncbi:MAG: 50S ribosomal protein L10 [Candidatus Thermoplasmatota archaeon]|nr:50S ribosomal protein L10 [Candidatus Thermoplasmatota archaeon]